MKICLYRRLITLTSGTTLLTNQGRRHGWTGVIMCTPLLPEVVPENWRKSGEFLQGKG